MTAPTITAALAVAEAAESNGWDLRGVEPSETSGKVFTFTRGAHLAAVRVSDAGVILDAELALEVHGADNIVLDSVTPRDKGKRETVTSWLEAARTAPEVSTPRPEFPTRAERAAAHRARVDAQLRLRTRRR